MPKNKPRQIATITTTTTTINLWLTIPPAMLYAGANLISGLVTSRSVLITSLGTVLHDILREIAV